MTTPGELREHEEIYGAGFHDGFLHHIDFVERIERTAPFTRSDWQLWVAAALGFVIGAAI